MAQPFKGSAIEILSDDQPLTALEIVKRAVRKGLLDEGKMTLAPERTMSAVLSNNIKQRGDDSEFVRRGDLFELKPGAGRGGGQPAGKPKSEEAKAERHAYLRAQFNGRAGEYSVVSELLFQGFDASVANVDDGTDVFAIREGRCFFFQVKTSAPVRNRCSYFIPPLAHARFNRPDAYYAFVMHSGDRNDFVVMPYCEVQKHMDAGRITMPEQKYRATLVWGDKVTLAGEDVSYYRRRWPKA